MWTQRMCLVSLGWLHHCEQHVPRGPFARAQWWRSWKNSLWWMTQRTALRVIQYVIYSPHIQPYDPKQPDRLGHNVKKQALFCCVLVCEQCCHVAMCLLSHSSHHLNIKRQGFAAVCKCQVHAQVRRYSVKLTDHTQSPPHSHPSISTCKHIKQARVIPSMRHYFIICILMVLSIALQLVLPWLEEIWDVF